MRLIASFREEERAYALNALLLKSNIESTYETLEDPSMKEIKYVVWIVSEEDVDAALEILEKFEKDPELFLNQERLDPSSEPFIKGPIKVEASSPLVRIKSFIPVTRSIVILCVVMFFLSVYQKALVNKEAPALIGYFGLTTLTMRLMYDVPVVFEEMYQFFITHPTLKIEEKENWPAKTQREFNRIDRKPFWKGAYDLVVDWPQSKKMLQAPLFTKIAQGELWRLFTPALLHGNFLHILFNMMWLWLLGKQMEFKVGKGRYLLIMLIVAVISNTAQYLMSGPFFLGYSGIICGLGGFIWVRQKVAPWEGYNIPKGTLLFLFVFIAGMVLLQMISLVVAKMHLGDFSVGKIANTAHVVGLLCGGLLAKIPFFYRLKS